jgi:hypothetical protein
VDIKHLLENRFPNGTTEYARRPLSACLFIGTEVISNEGLFDLFKKAKRPNFHDQPKPNLEKENRKAIEKTYLNASWLKKQKYVEGSVDLGSDARILLVNGKVPTDVIAALKKTLQEIEVQTAAHYKKLGDMAKRAPKTHAALQKGEFTKASYEALGSEVKLFDTPPKFDFKFTCGGADGKKVPVGKPHDLNAFLIASDVTELPALNADECKAAAELILKLFGQMDSEYMEHVYPLWASWFGEIDGAGSARSAAAKDSGWPELITKIDEYVNSGYSPMHYYEAALIKAVSRLIDKSIK